MKHEEAKKEERVHKGSVCQIITKIYSHLHHARFSMDFVYGAHSTEELHLKKSTATSLSRINVPITLDNPQNTQSALFIGTIFF